MELYFIGVVPPEKLSGEIMAMKERIRDEYGSKAALRSPPHLTLHMPFKMKQEKIHNLKERIRGVLQDIKSFPVVLRDFGAFPPKVIFIHVEKNEVLDTIHFGISKVMKRDFNVFNQNYRDQAFHPHVTIAFRDLKKQEFHRAWNYYSNQKFEETFLCHSVCILKHNGKVWEVESEISINE